MRTMRLVQTGALGTANIVHLISLSNPRESDKWVLKAIEASLVNYMVKHGYLSPEVSHRALAAVLAAYTLGQLDLFSEEPTKP